MKMNDCEVVEKGTIREIELARNLAREIERVTDQYGLVVPNSVMIEYNKLKEHYERQDRAL